MNVGPRSVSGGATSGRRRRAGQVVRTVLVVGAVGAAAVTCGGNDDYAADRSGATTPSASVRLEPDQELASRTVHGGLCANRRECQEVLTVMARGGWSLDDNGRTITGTVPAAELEALSDAVAHTALGEAPAATRACPLASDGQEVVYTWTKGTGSGRAASCQTAITDDDPLVAWFSAFNPNA